MELAILVFFLAIFGGILFLIFLIRFFLRRPRPRSLTSADRSPSGNSAGGNSAQFVSDTDFDDDISDYSSNQN